MKTYNFVTTHLMDSHDITLRHAEGEDEFDALLNYYADGDKEYKADLKESHDDCISLAHGFESVVLFIDKKDLK